MDQQQTLPVIGKYCKNDTSSSNIQQNLIDNFYKAISYICNDYFYSYNLYKQDVALLKSMNLTSYRFSISWPRIIPQVSILSKMFCHKICSTTLEGCNFQLCCCEINIQGIGKINQKGLDYYHSLIDELLDADIIPAVTLYHWDLPQVLFFLIKILINFIYSNNI